MARVRSGGGFGKFVLGWVLGFISTLLILGGLGFWAYKSASIKTVEKIIGNDITNNATIENKTIEDWVKIVRGVMKEDKNSYTIAKFEQEFDVKMLDDSMYGISLDKIKSSSLKNIKAAFEDTLNTATFNNVLSIIDTSDDLGLLDTILDENITYYVNDNILYTSTTFIDANKVKFEYEINDGVVKFGENSATIVTDGDVEKVDIMFRNIPINIALSSMSDVTKDLKIYEVMGYTREGSEGNYIYKDNGTEVNSIMSSLAEYTVGDLSKSTTFNNLYVYEILGYTENLGEYYNNGTKVEGVLSILAPSTLGDLSNTIDNMTLGQALDIEQTSATGVIKALHGTKITELSTRVDTLKVYEVMGYYEHEDKYYHNFDGENYTNEVTGIMKAIANTNVNELGATIDTLKASDIFDEDSSIIKLLGADASTTTIKELPDVLPDKINETTIEDLIDLGMVDTTGIKADTINSIKSYTIKGFIEEYERLIELGSGL